MNAELLKCQRRLELRSALSELRETRDFADLKEQLGAIIELYYLFDLEDDWGVVRKVRRKLQKAGLLENQKLLKGLFEPVGLPEVSTTEGLSTTDGLSTEGLSINPALLTIGLKRKEIESDCSWKRMKSLPREFMKN